MNSITLRFFVPKNEILYFNKQQQTTLYLTTIYYTINIVLNLIAYLVHSIIFGFGRNLDLLENAIACLCWLGVIRVSKNYVQIILAIYQMYLPIAILFKLYVLHIAIHVENNYEMFYFGASNTINLVTLMLIQPEFILSSVSFAFSAFIYALLFKPPYFDYNYTNFIFGVIWIIFLKYTFEKQKRQRFILEYKDIQWSYIIESFISFVYYIKDMNQWIAIVRYDKQTDQLKLERSNQQFRLSCGISNDISFRKFSRSLRLKSKQKQEKFKSFTYLLSKKEKLPYPWMYKKTKLQKFPTLEEKLRDLLTSEQDLRSTNSKLDVNEIQNRRISSIFLNQFEFHGFRFQSQIEFKNKYFSIQIIPGQDEYPFVVLFIDEENDKNEIYNLETKIQSFENIITQKFNQMIAPLNNSFSIIGQLSSKIFLKLKSGKLIQEIKVNQQQLFLSLIQQHNLKLYLTLVENVKFNFETYKQVKQLNLVNLLVQLKSIFRKKVAIDLIININSTDALIEQCEMKIIQIFINFFQNVWIHNQSKQRITLEINKNNFKNSIIVTLYQKAFKFNNYQFILESYEASCRKNQQIEIIDEQVFNHYIRQKNRIGWLVNNILLAEIGPQNQFTTEYNGSKIQFEIYRNLKDYHYSS